MLYEVITYRQAFGHFDPQLVARYDQAKIAALLQNARNNFV